jgi:hypothetical protein
MSLSISSRRFVALAAPFMVAPALLAAQSLRGSVSSVNRMYRQARAEDFSFFETPASVRRAVNKGLLVRLDDNADNFDIAEVGYPYVRKATLAFVDRLGAQYREGCGERLVVTSAVRPETRQPPNSTERSVHPTGMAIDLRRPEKAKCLRWLREALLGLEDRGLIEATEEHHPAHFHVAVFPTPYTKYLASRQASVTVATYVVRTGDTLSEIAREYDVSVRALIRANGLDDDTIMPGQELRIPND